MQESNGGSMGGSLTLFLAGAAIGGLLVALNTPKTGPELRDDLRLLGRRAKKGAQDLAGDAQEGWERVRGKAGEAGQEVAEEARSKAKEL
jgi:gas vesicle protein